MSNTDSKWHTNEEMHQRFVELLYSLVDNALTQFEQGYAVDVEAQYDRIAAMAVDHRKILWAKTPTGTDHPLGTMAGAGSVSVEPKEEQ